MATWDDFPTVDAAPKNTLSWDAFPDVKEEPMIDVSDTLKAAGQAIGGITTTAPHAFRQLYSGLDNPWQRSEGYKASQAAMDQFQQQQEAANQAAVESGDISALSRGMRQAGQSLGFSAGAMGASLAGGSAAGTAGRYIGGLAGPEGAIAGEAGGRVIGALGASYGAAYRMAGAQFLDDASKEIDAKFMDKLGRLPNEQEQKEAYDELLPLAQAFGHAEAGPEAIGNLAMAKAGKFILGLGIKNIKGLAANALMKVGAGAGGLATELGSETVTQVEQNRIEEQKNALLSGQSPPEQGPRTLGEYQTALGEVAPATLATMGLIGSVPTAYKAGELTVNAFKKPEIAAAADLVHSASTTSEETPLTTAAAEQTVQAAATAQSATKIKGAEKPFKATSAEEFEENLRRDQEEGDAADIQSAQMRSQEEASQAQAAADRQAQFEGLSQNEPAITAPVGVAIPAVGQEEEDATIQPEQQLPDGLGVLPAEQSQEVGQAPSPQVVGTTTTNSGVAVPSNLTNSVGTVQFLSRDDPNRLLLEDGFAYRTVSEGEVKHFAQEGALLTDPNLAGQRKKSRGQTSQKMFSHINPEHPEYGYRPNQLVIRVPINRIPIGTKGIAIRAQDAEVMRFDGEKWVGTPVSELAQLQAKTTNPAITELAPQGAAPTGIATQTGQPMSGDSGVALQKSKSLPRGFNKLASSPTREGIQKSIAKFYAGENKRLTPTGVPNHYAVESENGKVLSTNVVETAKGFYFGNLPKPVPPLEREIITPSEDKSLGQNERGEPIYERADGSVYRIRNDRKDRPNGHPDFGGDLVPIENISPAPTQETPSSPAAKLEKERLSDERSRIETLRDMAKGDVASTQRTIDKLEEKKSSGKQLDDQEQRALFTAKDTIKIYQQRLDAHERTLAGKTISPAAQKEPPLTPSGQVANEGGGPVTSNETEAGFQVQPPVETKETPQGEVSSAYIESKALEILLQKRPNLSATVAAKAKKYFATGDFDIIRSLPLPLRSDIDHSIQDADPKRLHAQLAADEKQREHDRKMEEDDRKADEEMAKRQAKLTESRRGAYDSIVGTPTGVEMNAVSEADGQESLALVNNSGDVPGVLNAFVGTSSQFLANPENETNFPDLWKILSAGRVDEGNFAYGRAFVFTDGIGVNASDRRNAERLGVTPAVAAVRRVLVHESLVHRGIYGLPAHLQMQVLQWMRQNTTPEQLDNLARDYPQYENWRNNPQQMLGLCEEYLAKTVEKITKFPKDGPLSKLFDLLRDIWRWITGETGDPTVQNLRDVIKLLKAGAVAADARLANGGKVDIKASNPSAKYALPSSDEYLKTNDIQGLEGDEPSSQYRRYANDYLNWRVRGTGFLNLVSPIYVGDAGGRMEAEGGPLQTRIGEDNRITIDIGNPIPSGFKGDQATAKKRIADAVDEEIIHAADQALISGSAIKSSRPAFANSINAELARAAERFRQMNERQAVDTPQQVTPQQIRGEIRAAYDRAIQGSGSVQAPIQQVFDGAKTQIPTLTEKQFGEQLQALYEDGSAFLVPADRSDTMLAAGAKWGVYDASGMPASYVGVMGNEVKASVASNIETALHSSRGLTGKVNEKVKGMAANAYGGIPMQMSLPPFYTSVSSREFYDFMKPMVVSKIDDMVKRGVDEGDVLATVVQPDFTDKVMEGARDDAKDVALSIFFNHGMLLAERKFEALMKSGNVAEADIQRDKIDAWTKWAYDKNHSFGTIGNAIQRVMEDPEYQGMYLLSNFASQLKNSQSDVTKANVGDPAALAKDINDLGQTTKDSSDNDVADALTGLQVDDEIAIGEAALTPENKTLWEETKNYLRTLARLTKARLKILAKNVKASNAAESADAEEARYVQMGLAGVDKLIAATQAKINKNFKKILGIPEAGKTRKPRTPKEEAAHPLIARMVARYAAKLGAGTNLDAALAALLPQGPSYRDEIINDVVSGIVGRANRSIKKPKAPGTLTDLTKQLKKILSENIKAESQSAPEESLGRKALRAFGFVTSNEQLVQEAWDKARAKVSDILREANLVETNESIEDKLNAILGEIPQQLYSTSQARSVIKDALEGTKFDNTNEILSDVKGAREAALKSINDAVEKEGNVDPARWQRDQSYIIHAFDGLVADLQKAKDAGIAASNKTLRDAVFGADAQKALKIIIRKLTAARPGIDAPLAPALTWKRLFEMTQTNQGELKGRMFDIVKDEPAFVNLDNANKQKLADILEKAWDARREQMLTKELERLTRKHRMTKKAAKALNNRPAILRKLDAGYFDYSDLAKLIGEEFGLRPMTAEEIKRAKEISARLAEDIFPHERTKLQDELQQLMVRKKLSLGEMLKAWWITAVLSGPKTAFTIGMSYLSGGFELVGHSMSILLNPKMSAKEKGDVLFDSIKNWWTRLAPEIKNAIMYVATGDKTLQDPAALMQSSFFENQFRKEMGRFSYSAAEKMIASDNKLMKAAGWFMTYGSRILNALDAFNYNITKAGSAPLVYALLNNSYKAGSMQTSKLFKEARQEIIDTEYGGTVPANTSRLDAWARNAAYQKLSKLTGMAENMSQVARTGNFTTDPGGLGGWLYNGLKMGDMFLQNKSKAFLEKAQKDLLRSDATWVERGMVGIAEFINAVALQTLPVLGLQFARFVANKLNQTISFIPVAGLIRLKETTGIEGREVHRAMIYRNQAIGVAMLVYMAIKLAEIADEPDDEKRGWGWEGSWSNLTPAEKRQRDATGLKENTIWYRDKNGKRVVANYINWPISPIIAAMAAMSDQIKYSPEKWAEGGLFKKSVAMAWAIKSAVSETSALSQFSELFGSSMASRDPVEAFSNKAARIVGGYAGGYVPRIFKDIDRMMKPEIHKYEGWENLEKELPFYRRMVGKEYLDIFGNPIAPSAKPTARELVEQPEGEAYKMLGRINSHGVWLAPAVAENRLVGKGGHKREMTDEEANRYVKIVGKGYSDFVIRQGERIISMPKDRAKKYVSEKTEDIRTKAVKQAIRN